MLGSNSKGFTHKFNWHDPLEILAKVPKLDYLLVRGCQKLTEPAVRKLQMALPKCKIVSDFPDAEPK